MQIDQDSRGQGRGYQYEILHQPSFSLAVLQLQAEQSIRLVDVSAHTDLNAPDAGDFTAR